LLLDTTTRMSRMLMLCFCERSKRREAREKVLEIMNEALDEWPSLKSVRNVVIGANEE